MGIHGLSSSQIEALDKELLEIEVFLFGRKLSRRQIALLLRYIRLNLRKNYGV